MNISLCPLKFFAKVSTKSRQCSMKFKISFTSEFHLEEDMAGATFMAIATSAPELVISCIGTFITEGEIGVGTIIGSTVFNVLAVPAICGLFTITTIHLDWWSVSRDCAFYGFSVIALIFVIYDYRVMWYEAAFLVVSYGVYLLGNQILLSARNMMMLIANLFSYVQK